MAGLFITFEGIEGSGKSTQIDLLEKALEQQGKTVLKLREPGGTPFGEALRKAVLESAEQLDPVAEAMLFASSRAQLLKEKIIPALAQNQVVIVDRFLDSSIAYQGFARELGLPTILEIHSHGVLKTHPHLTFYLAIDLETSMKRQAARGNPKDYFEKENHQFYQKLIAGYEECTKVFPQRIKKIDATGNTSTIQQEIMKNVTQYIN